MDNKVTDIKYKQLDKDPKTKETINNLEKFFLGEQGVGLLDALGLTPGKVQKAIDEQFDRDFDRILSEKKEYIINERDKRAIMKMEEFLSKNKNVDRETYDEVFSELRKETEVEVIKELMENEI